MLTVYVIVQNLNYILKNFGTLALTLDRFFFYNQKGVHRLVVLQYPNVSFKSNKGGFIVQK